MKRLAVASAMAVIGAVVAVPAAAAAVPSTPGQTSPPRVTPSEYEEDTAVAGTPDFSKYYVGCSADTGVEVCFQPHGDMIWVMDTKPDGSAAFGDWVNQLRFGSGPNDWSAWRQGTCTNRLGAYHWGYCNKNFYEWDTTNLYGLKGSRVAHRGETTYGVGDWVVTDNDE